MIQELSVSFAKGGFPFMRKTLTPYIIAGLDAVTVLMTNRNGLM